MVALSLISTRNLAITREWCVVRARRGLNRVFRRILRARERLHPVPRRILRMERANWRKFWRRANCPKCPYYSRATFMSQYVKFIRFKRKGDLGDLRSRRIRIHNQNLGDTIFAGTGTHFCTKFGYNCRTVGHTGTGTSPSGFSSNFTYGGGILTKILGTSKLSKMPLLCSKAIFICPFIEYVRFEENCGHEGLRGLRIQIHH